MSSFIKERNRGGQVFPFPEKGEIVYQNPPCFIWLSSKKNPHFHVYVYQKGMCIWDGCTENNYMVCGKILEPGIYSWDVEAEGEKRGLQEFAVSEEAVLFTPPTAREIYDSIPDVHPRTLFFTEDISKFRDCKTQIEVLKRNVEQSYKDGLFEFPQFHINKDALQYREYFGKYRNFCDRNLVADALAYQILKDRKAGEHGKRLMLHICSMTPHGPASVIGKYGDEIGLSNARVLPIAYDLLYDLLDDGERDLAEWTIFTYGLQCEKRLRRLNFCQNPGDSHAGRLPAYLGECAMALKYSNVADQETVTRWLQYAVEIYSGIFPHYGCPDGAWAEGSFYSSSYTKWFLPFFCEVERFTKKSFFDKPFYHNFLRFAVHFLNPDYENHPFGDGYWCRSEDKEWPGFFAQNPFRIYAAKFGNENIQKLSEKCDERNLYQLHLLDLFIGDSGVNSLNDKHGLNQIINNCECFDKAGFISMHSDIMNKEKDFACQVRASKYGSDSHRHADQGSFALFYQGESLISPSGYFGRKFGTTHHQKWTNTSKAHNTLLFNGTGQYENDYRCQGKILEFHKQKGCCHAVVSCGDAYPIEVKWIRTFDFSEDILTVTDDIKAEQDVEVCYPLHSIHPLILENGMLYAGTRKQLEIKMNTDYKEVVLSSAFDVPLNEDVEEIYHVQMPEQYHCYYTFSRAKEHRICCRYRLREERK